MATIQENHSRMFGAAFRVPRKEPAAIRVKNLRSELRHFQDTLQATQLAQTVLPLIVMGAVAFDTRFGAVHNNSESQNIPTRTEASATTESPILIEEGIIILPGFVDILPGATLRTSPQINKGEYNIARTPDEYKGKTVRAYNPRVVWGTPADPLIETSGKRSHPKQDPWIAFELNGQLTYVNAGPATSDVVDKSETRPPISVRKFTMQNISYYQDANGNGFSITQVSVAPSFEPDKPNS